MHGNRAYIYILYHKASHPYLAVKILNHQNMVYSVWHFTASSIISLYLILAGTRLGLHSGDWVLQIFEKWNIGSIHVLMSFYVHGHYSSRLIELSSPRICQDDISIATYRAIQTSFSFWRILLLSTYLISWNNSVSSTKDIHSFFL